MLGDRLRSLREKHNLTQEQIAKKIGISRGTYAHYEINKRRPDYETLIKITDIFNVSLDFLLTGKEFDNSNEDMWKELLDPKTELFFKDLKDAPDDKIEELIQFWEFIKSKK
ncbi:MULTISPECIES: helix-turn-helix domain-containing protein [Bacillus]|uniref:helix-turn-helix domain-containing protein n=1 Tax=Bacillus TaxID=1386 RepID=UPI0005D4393F|nr:MULTISPECIES: helix-turn-helix transcriptional regulator [Bacillus]KQL40384.1 DNA-binding protein [Bacillus sp. FJAT-21955]MCA1017146.1 helix-turn-helix domain-containing protein [Bacillus stratosphericus]KJF45767.1 DNA-binding protein [Bacillus altitudinis]MCY7496538.1 helix-turn-helix domain-containing protein [Bacillus altitudinis]MCY7536020.1 helix-turn-helix domain-containing protein [Bacillus altitudinis]